MTRLFARPEEDPMHGRLRSLLILVAATALLATACGGGGEEAGAGGETPAGETTETADAGGDTGGGYGYGGDGGGGGGSSNADVTVSNFSFDPATIRADGGDTLRVKNSNASTGHTFTVPDTDVDVQLDPLATEQVSIDLDPGDYEVICEFHSQMTATLSVA